MIQNVERWFLHSIIAHQLDHSPPHVPSVHITPHNHTANNNFTFDHPSHFYNLTGILTTTSWFLIATLSLQIILISVFLLLPPWRWPHGWPKHIDGHCLLKLQSYTKVHWLVYLINVMHMLDSVCWLTCHLLLVICQPSAVTGQKCIRNFICMTRLLIKMPEIWVLQY